MKKEAPEARKNHKTGTWSRLGGSWSGSWRPGRDFLGISAQIGVKMGARWRSWGQVGDKLRPRWAKIAPSWRSWAQLGRFWEHVGSILALFWHMGWIEEKLQKLEENIGFWVFGGA